MRSDNDDYKLQPIKSHHKQINLFHHLSLDLSAFLCAVKDAQLGIA